MNFKIEQKKISGLPKLDSNFSFHQLQCKNSQKKKKFFLLTFSKKFPFSFLLAVLKTTMTNTFSSSLNFNCFSCLS